MEYAPAGSIAGQGEAPERFREALRGIALDAEDRLWAVGDSTVKQYDAAGRLLRQWTTARPGHAVAVDAEGRVWVGESEQVEIFDATGGLVATWRDAERLGLITAIGFADGDVFLADATRRWIHRYDGQGNLVNEIGDKHRKGGFHIPNGVVDFAVDGAGVLHVANPGMHRVERWSASGEMLGRFGRFHGTDPQGFPGCCNPTNLALAAAGRVVVTEKAGPRAKLYDAEGKLLAVVADKVFDIAAKNMDVAVDRRGRIYVADTARLEIRIFEPVAEEVDA